MQTREGPYQYVKQRMTDGTAKDCVLDIMATFYFGDPYLACLGYN